jgi:hypothetical protein
MRFGTFEPVTRYGNPVLKRCWLIKFQNTIDSAEMLYNELHSLYNPPSQAGNRGDRKETPWARPLLD